MIRRLSSPVGGLALAVAAFLATAPTADAQSWGRGLGWYGNRAYLGGPGLGFYGPGYSGWNSPFYSGYPFGGSGFGISIGLGRTGFYNNYPFYGYNYPSYRYTYPSSTYMTSPRNYAYSAPSYYYTTPSLNTTSVYSTAPVYSAASYGMAAAPDANAMATQTFYRPPAGTASITVRLPANAQLWMNDQPTTPTGPERQFVTPAGLEAGKPYYFALKAQWEENGQTVTREHTLEFKAGDTATVDFNQNPPTANAAPVYSAAPDAGNGQAGAAPMEPQSFNPPPTGPAFLTVRLPAGARLWVEDYQSVQTGPERNLVSPPTLEQGKPYHYTLKAQWEENGQTVTHERTANIQAGSQVTVDFFTPAA
jgi:uncharacterized protein (TIGR03000 family)